MKSTKLLMGCESEHTLSAATLYRYVLQNMSDNLQLALIGAESQLNALTQLNNANTKEWQTIIGRAPDTPVLQLIKNLMQAASNVTLPDACTDDESIKHTIAKVVSLETEDELFKLDILLPNSNPQVTYFLSYYLSMFGREHDCLLQLQGESLVNIPFILEADSDLSMQIDGADIAPLMLNLKAKTMHVGDQEIKLSPTLFAWYSWLAVRRTKEADGQHSVTLKDNLHDDFLKHFGQLYSASHFAYIRVAETIKEDNGFPKNYMSEKKSRVNNLISALKHSSGAYLIQSTGERAYTQYGLALPAEKIIIVE